MSGFLFPDIPGQMGLASTRQLLKAGASEWDLTQLALRGQRVVRRVYRSGTGELTSNQMLVAGSLWAGPHAVMTGAHALAAHGLVDADDLEVRPRFLVPAQHRARRNALGMTSERTRSMPRSLLRAGVPVATPERALVDTAHRRELTASQLKLLTMTVLQRRRTTLARLEAEIAALGDANTGPLQDGMLGFRKGAWSPPEETLVAAVAADDRFPPMLANPLLDDLEGRLVGRPDGYFPDAGVVVQVHSRAFHTGKSDDGRDRWATTLVRDADYQTYGLVVVPVAPETLDNDLPSFLSTLLLILEAHRGQGAGRVLVQVRPA